MKADGRMPSFLMSSANPQRLWTLVDEPLVNQYFETIEELEEVLVLRCNKLGEMKQEIKNLTDYHWLNFS